MCTTPLLTVSASAQEAWNPGVNMGPVINSPLTEKASDISADGLTLYFHHNTPQGDINIFYSEWDGSAWGPPIDLGVPVNSAQNDYGPSVTTDGNKLYFTSDRPGGQGSFDIYLAERIGGVWQAPVNLGPIVNSAGGDLGQDINADDTVLWISRGWPEGSPTDEDIYYTVKVDGEWATPVPWELNTVYLEDNPNISSDGNKLYFTAIYDTLYGGGYGSFDIWVSERVGGVWQTPVNLGPGINTEYHDANPSISWDGNTMYFTRDEPAGYGGFDLYTATRDTGAEGTPPIQVLIDVHADPMFGPPLVQQQTYQEWVDATNWLMDVAEPRGAKISFLSTGEFMEWVLEDPVQGNPLMQRLYASGAQIGTHSHNKVRIDTHVWQALGPNPTESEVLQLWNDHIGAVNAVIAAALGISDPAGLQAVNCNRGAQIPGDPADRLPMMADVGFTIHEQGPDQEFYAYFSHYVMNPYRPSESGFLIEDPAGPVVLPPTGSILGINDFHFGILQDNRMPAKQGRFLLELLNWLHDVHVAGTDRVWTFGWGSHCHDYLPGTATRLEFTPMLDWLLNHFVGQPVGGQVAAAFASFPEARDAYITWEAGHPNESSFSYPASQTDWDLYPYLVPAVRYLTEAWYENPMPPQGSVRWHSLTASEAAGGPYALYVAYTTDGVPVTVDLSGSLGPGEVASVNPATGSAHALPTTAVEVNTIGTIVVPVDKIIIFPGTGDFDGNGHVDLYDYDQFGLCFTGPGGGPIDTSCEPGDFDGDGDIDCDDWGQFLQAWTEPDDPPEFPQCSGPTIPTVSEWGVVAMALLFLVAGTIVLRRLGPAAAGTGSVGD